jgi:acetyl esterase/lipase
MRWTKPQVIAVCGVAYATVASAQIPSAATPGNRPTATSPLLSEAPLPAVLHQSDTYRLWPGRAPSATSDATAEIPTITVFRPPRGWNTGTAVIVAPGGAYVGLSSVLEGAEPAAWFTTRGVTAFVLTYRVGATARLPIPLLDGARAVRFVRAHAAEFAIDPGRIGMMGFSAGGHLAATTAVEAAPGQAGAADPVERVSSRPDFLILGYPWLEGTQITLNGHSSYCDFALRVTHAPCAPQDYVAFNPVRRVTAGAPPTFIYHTTDDETVPVEGSFRFHEALRAQHVPVELHAFESGHHGSGLGGSNVSLSVWPELLQAWMRRRGYLPAPAPGNAFP